MVLLFDEEEQLKEKRADTNGDGRYDEFIYYEKGQPVRAEQDTNHDGKLDTKIRFGSDARPVVQERDTNGDGRADQWIDFEAGNPKRQRDDHNFDGKADSTIEFQAGVPVHKEEDIDFDGRTDRSITYAKGEPSVVEEDHTGDGRPDFRAEFNPDGTKKIDKMSLHFSQGEDHPVACTLARRDNNRFSGVCKDEAGLEGWLEMAGRKDASLEPGKWYGPKDEL